MIKSKQMLAFGVIAALGVAACGSDEAADEAVEEEAVTEDATEEDSADDEAMEEDAMEDDAMEEDSMEEDAMEDDAMTEDGEGHSASPQVELSTVGLTYDIGGRGDQSFNDSAAAGIEQAQADLGISANELVPNADGSNRAELLQLQADEAELVIGVGFLFADDVVAAAADNPETLFAVVDDAMLDFDNGGVSRCADGNCAGLTFAEEQGSFLVGAAAALKSETGTIGFIGGVSGFGLIEKFEAGFQAGAQAVNPDIVIEAQYITAAPDFDGFFAPDRAKEIALTMYDGGADIVYHAAGGSGAGLFEAAKEASEAGDSKVWGIGVDSDQYLTVDPAVQEYVLTSMLKRVDNAVYEISTAASEGTFAGGNTVYDLSTDGVGYSTSGGYIDDIADQLEDFKAQIVDGSITVPTEPS